MDHINSTLISEEISQSIETGSSPESALGVNHRGISILDLLILLANHKLRIIRFTAAGALFGLLISLCIPNIYTARTTLLPPQQQTSLISNFVGQLGPMSALAGKDATKNPTDMMVAILQSRTVSDSIIDHFELFKVYNVARRTDARDKLQDRTRVSAGKDGVISLLVEDRDPRRAADIANQYVAELYRMTQTLAVTEASQRRRFFEAELVRAKDDLAAAEVDLRRTQEGTGLIKLDDQAKAVIEAVGSVRGEIASREVSLRAMQTFATDRNPDVLRINRELEALRAQLNHLENAPVSGKGNVLLPTDKVPAAGMEYIRKVRELKYREAVYELLIKQYETARIDEAKSPAMIQVIDKAVVPERKSSPKRMLMALAAAFMGMMLACGSAIYSKWSHLNPAARGKLDQLSQSLIKNWKAV